MIRTRHQQQTLWGGVWAQEVDDLWEPWMRQADQLLDDDELVSKIFEAQGKRWKKSRTRGRLQTPAEVVLRLLVLKHVRNWSYQTLERESAPIWCTATSHGSGPRGCRTPRPWGA
jgi:transposase, IS5 family